MMAFPHHLKFAVYTTEKLLDINESNIIGDRMLYRRDIEMSKILAQTFGATHEILTPSDKELGRLLPNGSWTGMMGMLQRSEVDLIASMIGLNEKRAKMFDFSNPFHRAHIIFITRKPEYEPDPFVFFRPFSFEVWIFILMSILFTMIALYKMFRKSNSAQKLLLLPYATLLGQGTSILTHKTIASFLLMTWTFGAILLSYSYSAVLLSYLTFPPLNGVRTIPELADAVAKGKYECATYPGSFITPVLAKSNDSNTRIIGRSLQENKGSFYVEDVLENTKSSKKQAFIGGDGQFLPLASKYFGSEDEFLAVWQVIWMRKDFCCKAHLNRFISFLWTSGMYDKLMMDEVFMVSLNEVFHSDELNEKKFARKLTLVDLKGAFVILVGGHVLATVVLIFENVVSKLNECQSSYKKSYRKRKPTHFNVVLEENIKGQRQGIYFK